MKCTCPLGSFPTVTDVACSENFGQVQKAVLVDLSQSASVGAAAGSIVSNIQTIITAHKACITPFLQAPTQEAGEARTFGGGNDTPNGVEMFMGMGPSTFSAVMRGVAQSVIAKLKEVICFSEANKIGVYLINGDGAIEGIKAGTTQSPALAPIPIRALRISDKIHGGYEEPDRNEISWQFLPDYSDDLTIVVPTTGSGLNLHN